MQRTALSMIYSEGYIKAVKELKCKEMYNLLVEISENSKEKLKENLIEKIHSLIFQHEKMGRYTHNKEGIIKKTDQRQETGGFTMPLARFFVVVSFL